MTVTSSQKVSASGFDICIPLLIESSSSSTSVRTVGGGGMTGSMLYGVSGMFHYDWLYYFPLVDPTGFERFFCRHIEAMVDWHHIFTYEHIICVSLV